MPPSSIQTVAIFDWEDARLGAPTEVLLARETLCISIATKATALINPFKWSSLTTGTENVR